MSVSPLLVLGLFHKIALAKLCLCILLSGFASIGKVWVGVSLFISVYYVLISWHDLSVPEDLNIDTLNVVPTPLHPSRLLNWLLSFSKAFKNEIVLLLGKGKYF